MPDRRAAWSLAALAVLVGLATWGLSRVSAPSTPEVPTAPDALEPHIAAPSPPARPLRWIVAGGGASPELNQVQLEQDIVLARSTFGTFGAGLTLYAGGADSQSVQVLRSGESPEGLRARLAELFDPRGGRESAYRASDLRPNGAASAGAILEAIRGAITDGEAPLTLYLAGHGVGGDEPRRSRFLTWGPDDLTVDALAAVLDDEPLHRPVRLVMTSCYAGGFAELAFAFADPGEGEAITERCGFFATTWDRAASGCDPNPDRGAQEGYGIHFLHALRGQDRAGGDARTEIDLDGDGSISLMEAHVRARVASSSLDVPTTTSERFLRAALAEPEEVVELVALPASELAEERAVIAALGARLGLDGPEEATARLDGIHERAGPLVERLDELDAEIELSLEGLRADLLHRWPVLDDPWHPDFAAVFEGEGADIARFLEDSAAAARARALSSERDRLAILHDALLVEAAPLERLERAHETLALAARLHAEGGPTLDRYRAFLTCERGSP